MQDSTFHHHHESSSSSNNNQHGAELFRFFSDDTSSLSSTLSSTTSSNVSSTTENYQDPLFRRAGAEQNSNSNDERLQQQLQLPHHQASHLRNSSLVTPRLSQILEAEQNMRASRKKWQIPQKPTETKPLIAGSISSAALERPGGAVRFVPSSEKSQPKELGDNLKDVEDDVSPLLLLDTTASSSREGRLNSGNNNNNNPLVAIGATTTNPFTRAVESEQETDESDDTSDTVSIISSDEGGHNSSGSGDAPASTSPAFRNFVNFHIEKLNLLDQQNHHRLHSPRDHSQPLNSGRAPITPRVSCSEDRPVPLQQEPLFSPRIKEKDLGNSQSQTRTTSLPVTDKHHQNIYITQKQLSNTSSSASKPRDRISSLVTPRYASEPEIRVSPARNPPLSARSSSSGCIPIHGNKRVTFNANGKSLSSTQAAGAPLQRRAQSASRSTQHDSNSSYSSPSTPRRTASPQRRESPSKKQSVTSVTPRTPRNGGLDQGHDPHRKPTRPSSPRRDNFSTPSSDTSIGSTTTNNNNSSAPVDPFRVNQSPELRRMLMSKELLMRAKQSRQQTASVLSKKVGSSSLSDHSQTSLHHSKSDGEVHHATTSVLTSGHSTSSSSVAEEFDKTFDVEKIFSRFGPSSRLSTFASTVQRLKQDNRRRILEAKLNETHVGIIEKHMKFFAGLLETSSFAAWFDTAQQFIRFSKSLMKNKKNMEASAKFIDSEECLGEITVEEALHFMNNQQHSSDGAASANDEVHQSSKTGITVTKDGRAVRRTTATVITTRASPGSRSRSNSLVLPSRVAFEARDMSTQTDTVIVDQDNSNNNIVANGHRSPGKEQSTQLAPSSNSQREPKQPERSRITDEYKLQEQSLPQIREAYDTLIVDSAEWFLDYIRRHLAETLDNRFAVLNERFEATLRHVMSWIRKIHTEYSAASTITKSRTFSTVKDLIVKYLARQVSKLDQVQPNSSNVK